LHGKSRRLCRGPPGNNNQVFVEAVGACPRIDFLFKIEEFSQNKHSHMSDIGVKLTCEHYFLTILKSLGKRAFSDGLLVIASLRFR